MHDVRNVAGVRDIMRRFRFQFCGKSRQTPRRRRQTKNMPSNGLLFLRGAGGNDKDMAVAFLRVVASPRVCPSVSISAEDRREPREEAVFSMWWRDHRPWTLVARELEGGREQPSISPDKTRVAPYARGWGGGGGRDSRARKVRRPLASEAAAVGALVWGRWLLWRTL